MVVRRESRCRSPESLFQHPARESRPGSHPTGYEKPGPRGGRRCRAVPISLERAWGRRHREDRGRVNEPDGRHGLGIVHEAPRSRATELGPVKTKSAHVTFDDAPTFVPRWRSILGLGSSVPDRAPHQNERVSPFLRRAPPHRGAAAAGDRERAAERRRVKSRAAVAKPATAGGCRLVLAVAIRWQFSGIASPSQSCKDQNS